MAPHRPPAGLGRGSLPLAKVRVLLNPLAAGAGMRAVRHRLADPLWFGADSGIPLPNTALALID